MRAVLAFVAALWSLTLPSQAQDQALVAAAMESLQKHLGSTYACQPVVGDSYIFMARSTAQMSLQEFGVTRDDAILLVDKAETNFKEMAAGAATSIGALPALQAQQFCMEEFMRTKNEVDVAMARVRTSL